MIEQHETHVLRSETDENNLAVVSDDNETVIDAPDDDETLDDPESWETYVSGPVKDET